MKLTNYLNQFSNTTFKFLFRSFTLFTFVELVFCRYLLQAVGMNFETSEKGLIYFLILISSQIFEISFASIKKNILNTKLNLSIFIILNLYIAFAFVGNYLFLYPLNMNITFRSIILYIMTVCCVCPLICAFILLVEKYSQYVTKENYTYTKKGNFVIWLTFFIIIMTVGVIYLIAFNPAVLSNDSFSQISQAKGIIPLVNWHPAIVTLLIRFLLTIIDSPSFLAIVQCIFFSVICSSFMLFLHKKGLKISYAIILIVIFALMPNNAIHSITIWKDVPYSISILWLTLIFARLIYDFEDCKNKISFYIETGFCLICVCLFRQNGIVVYVISLMALLIFMKFKLKSIITAVVTIAVILLINGPVYKAFNVEDGPAGGKFIGLAQDIVGVYESGGTLSTDAENLVHEVIPPGEYSYSPYWAELSYDLDMKASKFVKIYIDTFIHNPQLMTRAILCRVDAAWNIKTGRDAVVYCVWYTTDKVGYEPYDNMYKPRSNNILTQPILNLGNRTTKGLSFNFFWRGGIHLTMILLCLVVAVLKKNYKLCFAVIPLGSQIISLLLSTGWMDYRFFWSISLVAYFFVILFLIQSSQEKRSENDI